MSEHYIGTIDEFPEGRGTNVSVQGLEIAVFNLDDDLYAIHDNCRHKNLPLHQCGEPRFSTTDDDPKIKGGIDYEEKEIRCPWHHLCWNLETGRNEALDTSIPTFDVTVDEQDVFIEI